jgi:hypothetical protein
MAVALQFWLIGMVMLIVGIFAGSLAAVLIPFGVLTMILGFVFGAISSGRGR